MYYVADNILTLIKKNFKKSQIKSVISNFSFCKFAAVLPSQLQSFLNIHMTNTPLTRKIPCKLLICSCPQYLIQDNFLLSFDLSSSCYVAGFIVLIILHVICPQLRVQRQNAHSSCIVLCFHPLDFEFSSRRKKMASVQF